MKETVFITDADTDLGRELVDTYLSDDFFVFCTVSKSDDDKEKLKMMRDAFKPYRDNVQFDIWNRKSPASTKGILLKAMTVTGTLSRIILLGCPVFFNINLRDIDFSSIESSVDSYIKGNLYLIKEAYKYYREKNSSDMLVLVSTVNNTKSFLDEIIYTSFSSILRSLIENNKENNINICGFESKSKKIEEFAGYIYRLLENRNKRISGRIFKFTSGVIR